MYVYCPVGERQRHLVMLMGTSRGTTEVRYLMALNYIETGNNMPYQIYNNTQRVL